MKKKLLSAAAMLGFAALLGASMAPAEAATISGGSQTWQTNSQTGTQQVGTLSGFSALGAPAGSTLNAVTLTLVVDSFQASVSAVSAPDAGTLTNLQFIAVIGLFDVKYGSALPNVELALPAYTGAVPTTLSVIASATYSPLPFTETQTLTGVETAPFLADPVSLVLGDSPVWNNYLASAGVSVSDAYSASGTLSITYDYTPPLTATPVPEPASLLLLGVGLAGLGMLRRRPG